MHQIRFRLGLRPRPRWGAYSALPDPLAKFKGAAWRQGGGRGPGEGIGKGRGEEGKGEEGRGKGGEGDRRREGREREGRKEGRGKRDRRNGRDGRENGIGMGGNGKGKEEGEGKGGEGLQPPNFNSWRRHWVLPNSKGTPVGALSRDWVGKIRTFRPISRSISRYILEKVQDSTIAMEH